MKNATIKPNDLIVKSLTAFIRDVGNQFQVSVRNQNLDIAYVKSRIRHEGVGFATKTLPQLGKHFDQALQDKRFPPLESCKRIPKGALPSFFNGLTRLVFALDGTLLDNPCENAIRAIRQLAYMFYKLEGDYPKELVNECINAFVDTDAELGAVDPYHHQHYGIAYQASIIMKQLFAGFDPKEITPRPGPGVTADKVDVCERYEPHVKYLGLHRRYPYSQFFYANVRSLIPQLQVYKELPVARSGTSKLALVPKDSRGPRIICTEPHEYMWLQQGLGRAMMDRLESHHLSKGQVNFYDQTVNGELALSASRDGKYVTLDMKEASDRISMALVEAVFDECPGLLESLQACSTESIRLPSGQIIRKNKFASMGSALCFPVMSAVHFTLAVASIQLATGCKTKAIAKQVFVYGDDLIVKAEHADHLFDSFPRFGLLFNPKKCCTTGRFRESCGVDAFNGVDVTPQRVKTYTDLGKDPATMMHFFAVFHGLFNRGLWQTAKVYQDLLEEHWGKFPRVSKKSKAVGWIVPRCQLLTANSGRYKWDKNLHSPYLKARIIMSRPNAKMDGGSPQLLRALVHARRNSSSLTRRGQTKIVWSRIPLSTL